MDYAYSKEYINPQSKDMHLYNEISQPKLHRNGSPNYPIYQSHPQMQMHSISPKNTSPQLLTNTQQSYMRGHPSQAYPNIENCPPLMNNHPMGEVSNIETPKAQRCAFQNTQDNYSITSTGDYNGNENIPYREITEKRQSGKQNTSHNLSGQKTKIQNSQTKSKIQNGKVSKLGLQRSNESSKQLDSEGNKNNSTAPPEEQNFNYYHEFCRLYTANVVLTNQLKELVGQKTDFIQKLTKLEKKSEELGDQDGDDKKKRFRRIASQIDRHYKCPHPSCQKSYGSEGSLNQHLKIKHPELYQGGPTNSIPDSERNSCYDDNLESFQQYPNDEDDEQEDCEGESFSYSQSKFTKKQKK